MSWQQLIDIGREAKQIADEERASRPQACPNDGEPLTSGPDGTLFCKFDGWSEHDEPR